MGRRFRRRVCTVTFLFPLGMHIHWSSCINVENPPCVEQLRFEKVTNDDTGT